jgi:multicomponent Na+:H+ antiporter subunit B
MLILGGLAVHVGFSLISVKLVIALLFVGLTNPTASHALAQSAIVSGLKPWFRGDEPDSGGRHKMHWELEITLFVFLIVTAVIALSVRDLLTSVVILSVYSFLAALIFVSIGAIDVAFTEAVVGAGIVGVFLVIAIFKTTRRCQD